MHRKFKFLMILTLLFSLTLTGCTDSNKNKPEANTGTENPTQIASDPEEPAQKPDPIEDTPPATQPYTIQISEISDHYGYFLAGYRVHLLSAQNNAIEKTTVADNLEFNNDQEVATLLSNPKTQGKRTAEFSNLATGSSYKICLQINLHSENTCHYYLSTQGGLTTQASEAHTFNNNNSVKLITPKEHSLIVKIQDTQNNPKQVPVSNLAVIDNPSSKLVVPILSKQSSANKYGIFNINNTQFEVLNKADTFIMQKTELFTSEQSYILPGIAAVKDNARIFYYLQNGATTTTNEKYALRYSVIDLHTTSEVVFKLPVNIVFDLLYAGGIDATTTAADNNFTITINSVKKENKDQPNPVPNEVYEGEMQDISLHLLDADGKIIQSKLMNTIDYQAPSPTIENTSVSFDNLTPGKYKICLAESERQELKFECEIFYTLADSSNNNLTNTANQALYINNAAKLDLKLTADKQLLISVSVEAENQNFRYFELLTATGAVEKPFEQHGEIVKWIKTTQSPERYALLRLENTSTKKYEFYTLNANDKLVKIGELAKNENLTYEVAQKAIEDYKLSLLSKMKNQGKVINLAYSTDLLIKYSDIPEPTDPGQPSDVAYNIKINEIADFYGNFLTHAKIYLVEPDTNKIATKLDEYGYSAEINYELDNSSLINTGSTFNQIKDNSTDPKTAGKRLAEFTQLAPSTEYKVCLQVYGVYDYSESNCDYYLGKDNIVIKDADYAQIYNKEIAIDKIVMPKEFNFEINLIDKQSNNAKEVPISNLKFDNDSYVIMQHLASDAKTSKVVVQKTAEYMPKHNVSVVGFMPGRLDIIKLHDNSGDEKPHICNIKIPTGFIWQAPAIGIQPATSQPATSEYEISVKNILLRNQELEYIQLKLFSPANNESFSSQVHDGQPATFHIQDYSDQYVLCLTKYDYDLGVETCVFYYAGEGTAMVTEPSQARYINSALQDLSLTIPEDKIFNIKLETKPLDEIVPLLINKDDLSSLRAFNSSWDTGCHDFIRENKDLYALFIKMEDNAATRMRTEKFYVYKNNALEFIGKIELEMSPAAHALHKQKLQEILQSLSSHTQAFNLQTQPDLQIDATNID